MRQIMLFLAAAGVALVAAGCNPAQQRQADRTGTTIQEKGREVFSKAATATENAALATKVKQALNLRQGLSTKRIEVNADAKTGAMLRAIGDAGDRSVAFSPEGRRLAAGGFHMDKLVGIYDVRTGQRLRVSGETLG